MTTDPTLHLLHGCFLEMYAVRKEVTSSGFALCGFQLVEGFSCIPEVELGHDKPALFQAVQRIPYRSRRERYSPYHLVQCPRLAIPKEGKDRLCRGRELLNFWFCFLCHFLSYLHFSVIMFGRCSAGYISLIRLIEVIPFTSYICFIIYEHSIVYELNLFILFDAQEL
jgi:hypothetical protein